MSDDEQNQPPEDENPNSITGRRRRKPFTRMMDLTDLSDQFMYETFEMGADLSGDEQKIQPSNPHARPEEPKEMTSTSSGLSNLLGEEEAEEEENPQVTTFSSLLQQTGEFQKPTKIPKTAPSAPPPGFNAPPTSHLGAPTGSPAAQTPSAQSKPYSPPAPPATSLGAALGTPPSGGPPSGFGMPSAPAIASSSFAAPQAGPVPFPASGPPAGAPQSPFAAPSQGATAPPASPAGTTPVSRSPSASAPPTPPAPPAPVPPAPSAPLIPSPLQQGTNSPAFPATPPSTFAPTSQQSQSSGTQAPQTSIFPASPGAHPPQSAAPVSSAPAPSAPATPAAPVAPSVPPAPFAAAPPPAPFAPGTSAPSSSHQIGAHTGKPPQNIPAPMRTENQPPFPAQPGVPLKFGAPKLDDDPGLNRAPQALPESPFAAPKMLDPGAAQAQIPVQQDAFSPPPLDSVPLMQVPDLSSDQALEDLILNAQPEAPYGTDNSVSARHRAVRRADFTRPRIPGLQQESSRHVTQETPQPKPKRSLTQKLRDFFKQLSAAIKSFRD